MRGGDPHRTPSQGSSLRERRDTCSDPNRKRTGPPRSPRGQNQSVKHNIGKTPTAGPQKMADTGQTGRAQRWRKRSAAAARARAETMRAQSSHSRGRGWRPAQERTRGQPKQLQRGRSTGTSAVAGTAPAGTQHGQQLLAAEHTHTQTPTQTHTNTQQSTNRGVIWCGNNRASKKINKTENHPVQG